MVKMCSLAPDEDDERGKGREGTRCVCFTVTRETMRCSFLSLPLCINVVEQWSYGPRSVCLAQENCGIESGLDIEIIFIYCTKSSYFLGSKIRR